ncbi:MAG: hypothetical protein JXA28_00005 [Bacteroidetes bacterium]|nr:hypothetical protein [Bacteroidota bacterium]
MLCIVVQALERQRTDTTATLAAGETILEVIGGLVMATFGMPGAMASLAAR